MLNLAVNNFPAMLAVFAVMVILSVADLFKRHLLSNRIVYIVTMLVSPFAALISVFTPISMFVHEKSKLTIPALIIGIILFLLTAVIYIRGHIAPIDKNAVVGRYVEKPCYCASKRLIAVGSAGTVLYGLFFVIQAVQCVRMMNFLSIGVLVFMILLLFVPLFNIGAMFFIIMYSAEFLALGVLGIIVLIPNLLVANGCIRYIISTDITKPQKALRFVLSLVPAANIFMGIKYMKEMSKKTK